MLLERFEELLHEKHVEQWLGSGSQHVWAVIMDAPRCLTVSVVGKRGALWSQQQGAELLAGRWQEGLRGEHFAL